VGVFRKLATRRGDRAPDIRSSATTVPTADRFAHRVQTNDSLVRGDTPIHSSCYIVLRTAPTDVTVPTNANAFAHHGPAQGSRGLSELTAFAAAHAHHQDSDHQSHAGRAAGLVFDQPGAPKRLLGLSAAPAEASARGVLTSLACWQASPGRSAQRGSAPRGYRQGFPRTRLRRLRNGREWAACQMPATCSLGSLNPVGRWGSQGSKAEGTGHEEHSGRGYR